MKRHRFHLRKIVLILIASVFIVVNVTAQDHVSKNNYTGNWEDLGTWDIGDGVISNNDIINIYGRVNRNLDLTINNNAVLNVYDTLIIYGNFTIGENGNLNIISGGVLIVYGNAIMDNRVDIDLDSYFVVFGNYSQGNNSTIDAPTDDTLLYVTGVTTCGGGGTVCPDADLVGDEDDIYDNPDLDEIIEATSNFITPRFPTLCAGGSLVLSIRDDGTNYEWFETSTPGTILSTEPTLTITAAGTYDVDFDKGGVAQAVVPVTATISGTVAFSLSSVVTNESGVGLNDGEIDLTVTPSGTYTYDWSNGLTTEDLSGLGTGNYIVEVEDDNCRLTETFSVGVGVCTDPSLSTITAPEICNGSSYDLSNVVVVDANSTSPTYTYHSATPALPGNELASTTVSPTTTTTYYILGTNGSCTDELAVDVTVNPLPVFTPTADSPICYGASSLLDANISGGFSYSWTPTGAELTNATSEIATYTPGSNPASATPITKTFTVLVTNTTTTCSDTGTVDVVVNRTPETGPQYHISNTWP